jgi:hypothetical protein
VSISAIFSGLYEISRYFFSQFSDNFMLHKFFNLIILISLLFVAVKMITQKYKNMSEKTNKNEMFMKVYLNYTNLQFITYLK